MMLNSKSVGSKITIARKKINLSQAELARQVSISPQAVGKWERGESMPDIATLNLLAGILDVDLNYFSDSFQSVESIDKEPVEKQQLGTQNEKQNKKLNWDMSRGNWVDADFSGLKNLHEKFSESNLKNCKFIGSEMPGLVLKANNVDSCDFSNSDLSKSKIQASNLTNNVFKNCSLKEAEFSECEIKNCDFSGADFTGVEFKSANIVNIKIADAKLNSTSFKKAHIADTVFEGLVEDCYFDNCSFSKVTFKNAKLINVFFKCKNLKKLQFIDCEADRMSYEFLKNGKADLAGISLLA